ncbi:hypothetical protein BHM03_00033056 [Ensete ventricosum]|nr:hypothetical protein BHM03_00033056 [Ensete ventricosum]
MRITKHWNLDRSKIAFLRLVGCQERKVKVLDLMSVVEMMQALFLGGEETSTFPDPKSTNPKCAFPLAQVKENNGVYCASLLEPLLALVDLPTTDQLLTFLLYSAIRYGMIVLPQLPYSQVKQKNKANILPSEARVEHIMDYVVLYVYVRNCCGSEDSCLDCEFQLTPVPVSYAQVPLRFNLLLAFVPGPRKRNRCLLRIKNKGEKVERPLAAQKECSGASRATRWELLGRRLLGAATDALFK